MLACVGAVQAHTAPTATAAAEQPSNFCSDMTLPPVSDGEVISPLSSTRCNDEGSAPRELGIEPGSKDRTPRWNFGTLRLEKRFARLKQESSMGADITDPQEGDVNVSTSTQTEDRPHP